MVILHRVPIHKNAYLDMTNLCATWERSSMWANYYKRRLCLLALGASILIGVVSRVNAGQITGIITGMEFTGKPYAIIAEPYIPGVNSNFTQVTIFFEGGGSSYMIVDSKHKQAMVLGALSRMSTGRPITLEGVVLEICGGPPMIAEPTNIIFN